MWMSIFRFRRKTGRELSEETPSPFVGKAITTRALFSGTIGTFAAVSMGSLSSGTVRRKMVITADKVSSARHAKQLLHDGAKIVRRDNRESVARRPEHRVLSTSSQAHRDLKR